ncbi:hypothetical protein [Pelagicoccus albus]|uniref:Uncharacterized protein n=1 Tax=Pelagicoccus albus TaxID=415222 RepID=A0A7X1B698_9BACT|nr:hypothetical protein [Pelagicoccus albus]MBC2606317.1 hypothetical protein [Pelagicoccus albus]
MEYEIQEMRFKKGENVFIVLGTFILIAIAIPLIPLIPSDFPRAEGSEKRIILMEVGVILAGIIYLVLYLKLRSSYKLDDEKLWIKRPFFSFTIKYDKIRNYYWDRGKGLNIEKLLIEEIGNPHDPYEIIWNRIQKEDQKNFMKILSTGVKAAKKKREANQSAHTTTASAPR